MWKLTLTLIVSLVLGVVLVNAAGAVTLVFEGEHYSWIKPTMTVGTGDFNGSDSGGHVYVELRRPHAETETGPGDDGSTTYKVYAPVEEDYAIWGLVRWYDGCGNSFFTLVDDMTPEDPAYLTDARYQEWHWVKGKTFHLTVGWHLIRFQNREDGAKLDQFLITTAEDFTPTRRMPETSPYLWRPEQ